jgi:hypothetical protein
MDLYGFTRQGVNTMAIEARGRRITLHQAPSCFMTTSGVIDAAIWDNTMVRGDASWSTAPGAASGAARSAPLALLLCYAGAVSHYSSTETTAVTAKSVIVRRPWLLLHHA